MARINTGLGSGDDGDGGASGGDATSIVDRVREKVSSLRGRDGDDAGGQADAGGGGIPDSPAEAIDDVKETQRAAEEETLAAPSGAERALDRIQRQGRTRGRRGVGETADGIAAFRQAEATTFGQGQDRSLFGTPSRSDPAAVQYPGTGLDTATGVGGEGVLTTGEVEESVSDFAGAVADTVASAEADPALVESATTGGLLSEGEQAPDPSKASQASTFALSPPLALYNLATEGLASADMPDEPVLSEATGVTERNLETASEAINQQIDTTTIAGGTTTVSGGPVGPVSLPVTADVVVEEETASDTLGENLYEGGAKAANPADALLGIEQSAEIADPETTVTLATTDPKTTGETGVAVAREAAEETVQAAKQDPEEFAGGVLFTAATVGAGAAGAAGRGASLSRALRAELDPRVGPFGETFESKSLSKLRDRIKDDDVGSVENPAAPEAGGDVGPDVSSLRSLIEDERGQLGSGRRRRRSSGESGGGRGESSTKVTADELADFEPEGRPSRAGRMLPDEGTTRFRRGDRSQQSPGPAGTRTGGGRDLPQSSVPDTPDDVLDDFDVAADTLFGVGAGAGLGAATGELEERMEQAQMPALWGEGGAFPDRRGDLFSERADTTGAEQLRERLADVHRPAVAESGDQRTAADDLGISVAETPGADLGDDVRQFGDVGTDVGVDTDPRQDPALDIDQDRDTRQDVDTDVDTDLDLDPSDPFDRDRRRDDDTDFDFDPGVDADSSSEIDLGGDNEDPPWEEEEADEVFGSGIISGEELLEETLGGEDGSMFDNGEDLL